jgi:peptidyl-dipeptidase Dcp
MLVTFMPRNLWIACWLTIVGSPFAAAQQASSDDASKTANDSVPQRDTADMEMTSPLLAPWTGPYGGVPPWSNIRTEEFVPAFDIAIANAESEIDTIAENADPPTFANTILAMEQSGEQLRRLQALFGVYESNLNVGPVPDIEKAVVPKLSEHQDRIYQNKSLFERIETIAKSDAMTDGKLTPAEIRIVDDVYKTFVRRGARLEASDKAKLSQINTRLARLFTDFSQNVLEDEKGYVTWISDTADLAGLPDSVVEAMASAAKERDYKGGKYAITNTRSSMDPFLTYADNRSLRETVWRNYYNRGDNGDKYDNNAIIKEILKLRAARAKLLGYPTHAHWRMEPTMAKDPQAAMDLMTKVWPKAVARVKEEVADMQAIMDDDPGMAGEKIKPWDYRYYAEKVRKEKYDLDLNEVTPYLQLDKLTEAMMWAAGQLYGLEFKQVTGLPVFHPDVTTCGKSPKPTDRLPGLWYSGPVRARGQTQRCLDDGLPRAAKRGSTEIRPIVSNNSNFVKAGDGVTLISWDDAITLFHEFGHALHSLLVRCEVSIASRNERGARLRGVSISSQRTLVGHARSAESILRCTIKPVKRCRNELLAKIKNASTFNQRV